MFIFFFDSPPVGLPFRAGLKEGKKAPGKRLSALTPVPDSTEFVRDPDGCL